MILALKIKLLSGACATSKWEGVIEMDSSSSLEDLHLAIQSTLNFDNDHLYEFFTAKSETSRQRVTFDDENGGLYERTVESLYPLPKGHHLYYLFDYGDDWLFSISRAKAVVATAVAEEPEIDPIFPRLIFENGERPEQYPSMED